MRFRPSFVVIFLLLIAVISVSARGSSVETKGATVSSHGDRQRGGADRESTGPPLSENASPYDTTGYRFSEQEPVLIRVFAPDAVREAEDMVASIEINFSGDRRSSLFVHHLAVVLEGEEVFVSSPGEISGDGGWYRELTELLETMSPVHSGLTTHRLMVPIEEAQDIDGVQSAALRDKALDMIEDARSDTFFLENVTRLLIDFPLPLSNLAGTRVFAPGREIDLRIVLRVTERSPVNQRSRTIALDRPIRILDPFPRDDLRFYDDSGTLMRIPVSWHAGDLHVHSCKDEASLFGERGCPDCQAESLNWGDDNTLEDLKGQYTALGATWFTITSHSYCLEQSFEYEGVRTEAQSLSDASFFIIPDTELSSLEEGPQTGQDLGDLICPDGSNHSGAHFIQFHKPGGGDGFLENCDDPIYSFIDNISQIRDEGGFGVVNHPNGDSWAWNSIDLLGDREDGGYHGIEIWNGPAGGGQDGHVGFWVDRLLEGGKFYAYSGSDTHDDAFDFGWNHALMFGPPSQAKLKTSLMHGRHYISNHQLLATLVYVPGGGVVLMGGEAVTGPDVESVRLFILSNTGTKTGAVTIFRGTIGAESEEVLATFAELTGSRLLRLTVPVGSDPFYIRAYSEIPGENLFAYANPIWIE